MPVRDGPPVSGCQTGLVPPLVVSNPDKVIFPDPGITKGELVEHYVLVGPRMLDFVAGRPLTLQRFPAGIGSKGFMQKNAAEYFPDSIRRFPVPKRDGGQTVYPVVDRAEDLAYLANQNTVTFHMWTSSVDTPLHPDWLVIDLDPELKPAGTESGEAPDDKAERVRKVRAATSAVAKVLASFGIDSFPVATGSKGFHVWVPLDGTARFDRVSLCSRAIAGLTVLSDPELLTTEFLKRNRRGRVYVDWLRNGPGSTIVAPFSLRPLAGAPVAVPMRWDELEDAEPAGWVIGNLGERLTATGSVETSIAPQSLPVDDIVHAAREGGVDLDTPHDRFGRT